MIKYSLYAIWRQHKQNSKAKEVEKHFVSICSSDRVSQGYIRQKESELIKLGLINMHKKLGNDFAVTYCLVKSPSVGSARSSSSFWKNNNPQLALLSLLC